MIRKIIALFTIFNLLFSYVYPVVVYGMEDDGGGGGGWSDEGSSAGESAEAPAPEDTGPVADEGSSGTPVIDSNPDESTAEDSSAPPAESDSSAPPAAEAPSAPGVEDIFPGGDYEPAPEPAGVEDLFPGGSYETPAGPVSPIAAPVDSGESSSETPAESDSSAPPAAEAPSAPGVEDIFPGGDYEPAPEPAGVEDLFPGGGYEIPSTPVPTTPVAPDSSSSGGLAEICFTGTEPSCASYYASVDPAPVAAPDRPAESGSLDPDNSAAIWACTDMGGAWDGSSCSYPSLATPEPVLAAPEPAEPSPAGSPAPAPEPSGPGQAALEAAMVSCFDLEGSWGADGCHYPETSPAPAPAPTPVSFEPVLSTEPPVEPATSAAISPYEAIDCSESGGSWNGSSCSYPAASVKSDLSPTVVPEPSALSSRDNSGEIWSCADSGGSWNGSGCDWPTSSAPASLPTFAPACVTPDGETLDCSSLGPATSYADARSESSGGTGLGYTVSSLPDDIRDAAASAGSAVAQFSGGVVSSIEPGVDSFTSEEQSRLRDAAAERAKEENTPSEVNAGRIVGALSPLLSAAGVPPEIQKDPAVINVVVAPFGVEVSTFGAGSADFTVSLPFASTLSTSIGSYIADCFETDSDKCSKAEREKLGTELDRLRHVAADNMRLVAPYMPGGGQLPASYLAGIVDDPAKAADLFLPVDLLRKAVDLQGEMDKVDSALAGSGVEKRAGSAGLTAKSGSGSLTGGYIATLDRLLDLQRDVEMFPDNTLTSEEKAARAQYADALYNLWKKQQDLSLEWATTTALTGAGMAAPGAVKIAAPKAKAAGRSVADAAGQVWDSTLGRWVKGGGTSSGVKPVVERALADGDSLWLGDTNTLAMECHSPCSLGGWLKGLLQKKVVGGNGEAVETQEVVATLDRVKAKINQGVVDDEVKEYWRGIVRDTEGRWAEYQKSTSYFYGPQPAPDLTNPKQVEFMMGALDQEKSFIQGVNDGSFSGNFEQWIQALHKQQAYKGTPGKFTTGAPYSPGGHTLIVQDDVLSLAKKYGDPYSVNRSPQKVELPGIDDKGLPYDIWMSQDKVVHQYPDARYRGQYLNQMQQRLENFNQVSSQGTTEEALTAIAEYYQYGINSRMFTEVNQSLFATQANAMLKQIGLAPVEQGILDFTAMRLQPDNFAKYFKDEVLRVNPQAQISKAVIAPDSVAVSAQLKDGQWVLPSVSTIPEAQSFKQLYQVLDQKGGLQGSQKYYSADELKRIIDDVRSGKSTVDYITSKDGLRKTVTSLLGKDQSVVPSPRQVIQSVRSIQDAGNFQQLYQIIDNTGGLQGSTKYYSSEELKGIIDGVRNGKLNPQTITNTNGLRDKVQQLMKSQSMKLIPSIFARVNGLFNILKISDVYAQESTSSSSVDDLFTVKQTMDQKTFTMRKAANSIKHQLNNNGEITNDQVKQTIDDNSQVKAEGVRSKDKIIVMTGGDGTVEFETETGNYSLDVLPIGNVNITLPFAINISEDSRIIPVGVNVGNKEVKKIDAVGESKQQTGTVKAKITIFYDKNNNGKFDSDEKTVPWAGVVITLSKEIKSQDINLLAGWNLISVSLDSGVGLTASKLIDAVDSQGGKATAVSTLVDGVWKTYVSRGTADYSNIADGFKIEPGKSYFVKTLKKSSFQIAGKALTAPVKLSLQPGWNAVGIPLSSKAYKADGLIDKASGGAGTVAWWDSGLWDAFVKKENKKYGNNFNILNSKGYILKVGQGMEFSP